MNPATGLDRIRLGQLSLSASFWRRARPRIPRPASKASAGDAAHISGRQTEKSPGSLTGSDLGPNARSEPPWAELGRDPYLLETSVPGVFAVGDVRSDSVKRAAAAVGEGSIAIRFVSEHLAHKASAAARVRR
jgi:hypothetical protein